MVIIIWLMYALLGLLGLYRQQVFIFLFFVLLAYLYLIGFISPALRSSAMILLALAGPLIRRQTFSLYSVVFLADLFVLANPYFLLFDISFQLSFLAVFGLIFYTNFFNYIYRKIPNTFKVRETLSVTSAAQMFTWPLTAYYFGNFSFIAAIANFLALPLFPFILVFTILLAIFGQLSFLWPLFFWPLDLLLRLCFKLMEILGSFQYAALNISGFDWQFLLLSFVFVIMITIIIKPQKYEAPD
jgi:competence protein ComEC